MQAEPLTWQDFFFRLLLSLAPAVTALVATYITLRHQRKVKADELKISSSLKARELMFGVYEKRLAQLLEQSAALGQTAAKHQTAIHTGEDVAKNAEAFAGFLAVHYNQALQLTGFARGIDKELAAIGQTQRFEHAARYIKSNLLEEAPDSAPADPIKAVRVLLTATGYMIQIQRAIVETKAEELFQDYLPTSGEQVAKR